MVIIMAMGAGIGLKLLGSSNDGASDIDDEIDENEEEENNEE